MFHPLPPRDFCPLPPPPPRYAPPCRPLPPLPPPAMPCPAPAPARSCPPAATLMAAGKASNEGITNCDSDERMQACRQGTRGGAVEQLNGSHVAGSLACSQAAALSAQGQGQPHVHWSSIHRQVGRPVGCAAQLGKGIGSGRRRYRRRRRCHVLLHHLHEQLVPACVLMRAGRGRASRGSRQAAVSALGTWH